MDPEVEAKYDEYYKLLASTKLAKEEQDKLKHIKAELEKANLKLGNKITEEVEYKLIEDKVALAKSKKDIFDNVQKEDRDKILAAWDKVLSSSTSSTD